MSLSYDDNYFHSCIPENWIFSSPAQDELFWSLAIHLPSSICLSVHTFEPLSSETPWPVLFKLHVEPSVDGGLKIVQMVKDH